MMILRRLPLFLAAALIATSAQAQSWTELKKAYAQAANSGNFAAEATALRNVGAANSKSACDLIAGAMKRHHALHTKVMAELEEIDTKREKYFGQTRFQGGELEHKQQLEAESKAKGAQVVGHEQVLAAGAEALAQMTSEEAVKWLASKGLTKKPWPVQAASAAALGKMAKSGNSAAVEALVKKGLKQRDARVVVAALEGLGAARATAEATAIAKQLGNKAWQVRAAAAAALADVGAVGQVGALIDQLEKEDGRVNEDIAEALVRLTGVDHDDNAGMWRAWYGANKDKLKPGTVLPRGQARQLMNNKAKKGGSVGTTFYGIKTKSNSIVFVIDISDSMNTPAGGTPGKEGEDEIPEGVTVTGPGAKKKNKQNVAVIRKANETIKAVKGDKKINVAKTELIKAIAALPVKARFAIVWYNQDVKAWTREMQQATPDNKQKAFDEIKNLTALGMTNIFDALERGFNLAGFNNGDSNYAKGADTVFLLSDGSPNAGRFTQAADILREVKKINETRKLTIHTIGIGPGHDATFMQQLAEQNGGQYVSRK